MRAVGARRVVLIHWDDFFRPLSEPLRALPYAGDDLDVSMRVLDELAAQRRCRAAPADGVAARRTLGRERFTPWDLTCCAGAACRRARVRRRPPARLAGGAGRGPGGRHPDCDRRDLGASGGRRRSPGSSGVVAFLGAVLVLAKLCDDEGLFEAAGAAIARGRVGSRRPAAARVRHRLADHRRPQPGRHRRAADPGGAGHGAPAAHPGAALRLRHRAPGQRRLAAAAGVEPDQFAGLSHGRHLVHPIHRC